jgi:hypothetical protein
LTTLAGAVLGAGAVKGIERLLRYSSLEGTAKGGIPDSLAGSGLGGA